MSALRLPAPAAAVALAPPRAVAIGVVCALALALIGGDHEFGGLLPGRQLAPWPLVPAFAAAVLGTCVEGPGSWLERASSRGPHLTRAARVGCGWLVVLLGVVVLPLIAGADASEEMSAFGLRNACLIGGLALSSSALLPPGAALLIPATYLGACMVAGFSTLDAVSVWALPFYPSQDATLSWAAPAFAALATLLVVARGTRARTT